MMSMRKERSGILTYKYKTLMSFEAETEGTKVRKDISDVEGYFVSMQDKL